jgi:hypothetical protein
MLKTLSAVFFSALVVCGSAWILWTSLDFQECMKSHGEDDPAAVFVGSLSSYRHCIGAYITDKNAVITAIGTLVIAVFTTVLGIFTMSLAKSTRIAADATTASVDLARDIAKRQLRAYVTVNGVIRTKDPGDLNAEGFAVLVDIKNSGQTPASDLLQWTRIEIREFPLVTRLPIHCLENPTRGILPPETKSVAFPTFTRALTNFEENAILANHTAVYVYGEIEYLDVFGDRHLTQFRFRCNGQGYPLGMFKPDGEGNEAA